MTLDKELRELYVEELVKIAKDNNNIMVLDADLMKAHKTNIFKDAYPERYIDVGVAEANMIGIAAGLANMGKIPFTHTFTPFSTRRVYDQIAISVGLAYLPVKIVGSDPGVTAELNGQTHMSFEDAGIMRNLPKMTIVEPVDIYQLRKLLPQIIEHDGPVYIRLDRKSKNAFFDENVDFKLGKIHEVKDGEDITIITSGICLFEVMKAVEKAENEGISVKVLNMHTLKPVDSETIIKAAKKTNKIITVENHNIINGWGSAVAEVVSENYPVKVIRMGIKDHYGEVGKSDFLMKKYGIDADSIYKKIVEEVKL
ncbi:transketolase family protein [Marinitoga aeolica]|jgi:transketolase|uniref:Transketolase family protein n=1 Tax=Marinitoga aeolica TaxID=2809031 RepID=A0ABY8PSX4_9BACT|nr:transketolase C-terminal domain-containing protein [Marinitoga aeolica]WGS65618.1 transketolase family protein [Marinitoga aeolica]